MSHHPSLDAPIQTHKHFLQTSGLTSPVWTHTHPPNSYPSFPSLNKNITSPSGITIIGAGIAGIHTAYELITRGHPVTLLEARHILSGESGRTSGHLSSAVDDGYIHIASKHGKEGASLAAESHAWAIARVENIAQELGIDGMGCDVRGLNAYRVPHVPANERGYGEEIAQLRKEVQAAREAGVDAEFVEGLRIKGWDGVGMGATDGVVFHSQATFHPTRYLSAVLGWLKEQPQFECFVNTRVTEIDEKSSHLHLHSQGGVKLATDRGYTVFTGTVIEATNIPLQKLSIVAEMAYYRTYCIAMRIPKGSVEDCLIYDTATPYKYTRITPCDDADDYLVIGGCDHKVGQEDKRDRFGELEKWTRARVPSAGKTDFAWSGQILEPLDAMAFIGRNQGSQHTYVVTGDSGNGLTHGVLAGKVIADEIEGRENPWAVLYNPRRMHSIRKSLTGMLRHDANVNAQYKRWVRSDVSDIEDIAPGAGGVLHESGKGKGKGKPVAVYRDSEGGVHRLSAVCPHMKGVVCWNGTEKSWDCPVHGSRFSGEGMCVQGPARGDLAVIT
ncbi:FAD-dependent oxidoreductase [Aspergillus mulundensis]|uniref:FAD dependent oxidoreductase n=1 Tax=Aspergillus mulundensis TaxID=1810919 RepID=A0A3D8T591_9EURO|nr:FAD dependent oxidoreductase [Aspergillus mulundensis]RDW93699.1 FAD dependent oxidoreductase [Aspergillus mulundensis]